LRRVAPVLSGALPARRPLRPENPRHEGAPGAPRLPGGRDCDGAICGGFGRDRADNASSGAPERFSIGRTRSASRLRPAFTPGRARPVRGSAREGAIATAQASATSDILAGMKQAVETEAAPAQARSRPSPRSLVVRPKRMRPVWGRRGRWRA